MSWAVTVNDLATIDELPLQILQKLSWDNPLYLDDANLAFRIAKAANLDSATLSGGRTPSPYGMPDTVVISVVGFDGPIPGEIGVRARDFNAAKIDTILSGPDSERQETNVPLPGSDSQE